MSRLFSWLKITLSQVFYDCQDNQVYKLLMNFQCDRCSAVYHRLCFTKTCPKCERLRQRDALLGKSPEEVTAGGETDYSIPHT